MTKGTLPPQAYTREMLTQAFQWVQTQPESIRKLADSADALVGLYLRAKRSGDANLETSAPVSTENFRANLKSLATELQQFSNPGTATVPKLNFSESDEFKNSTMRSSTPFESGSALIKPAAIDTQTQKPSNTIEKPISPQTSSSVFHEPIHVLSNSSPNLVQIALDTLDPKYRLAVQKVQIRFNLSSEIEALRMLIALGAERTEKL